MLKETADVILEKDSFSFSVEYPVTKRKLFRKVTHTEKKDFTIPALCLHSMVKISREVLNINPDHIKGNMVNSTYEILNSNGPALIKIVAYAILNNDQLPDEELLRIIGFMTSNDLVEAYNAIVKQLNVTGFISSIILIRNMNLMEMNPKEEGS